MTGYDQFKLKIPTVGNTVSFFLFCYTTVSLTILHSYIQPLSLPFLLGILAFPFTFRSGRYPAFSYRYAVIAMLWLTACYFLPVKTFLFFSTGFAVLFFVETWFGKAGFLSAVTLLLLSPIFQYAANVFSFPIRLQLTQWAVQLFEFMLNDVSARGNVIYYQGNEFSVDPACMGLNMLVASLLLGVIFIGFYQRKLDKDVQWYCVLLCLASVVILNVISNLVRILLLVLFNLVPGNWLHDASGLLCLVIYVLVPASFLARFIVQQLGKKVQLQPAVRDAGRLKMTMHIILLAAIALSAFRVAKVDTFSSYTSAPKKVYGYNVSMYAPGIVQLESSQALIYVKYIRSFYDSDHNPTICWKGSGYELQQIKEDTIAGHQLYTALLVNGNEKLYTAWWYGNHQETITSQMEWRWNMIKEPKRYAIINITAASEKELKAGITKILQENKLTPLFIQ